MATINNNGQTCLEARGIEERSVETVRSDYNANNEYNAMHPDALSDGDVMGKGSGHPGHGSWLPNCQSVTNAIDYSNFDTFHGGGSLDIQAREQSIVRELYNANEPYGAELINTAQNIAEGQYFVGQTVKHS